MDDAIRLVDLEVWFRVGVTDEERARPQRLLVTLELWVDMHEAVAHDDLGATIDYSAVARGVMAFGQDRQWRLIEKLAVELAAWVLDEFVARRVAVEVKKFVVPHAGWVSVRVIRP